MSASHAVDGSRDDSPGITGSFTGGEKAGDVARAERGVVAVDTYWRGSARLETYHGGIVGEESPSLSTELAESIGETRGDERGKESVEIGRLGRRPRSRKLVETL